MSTSDACGVRDHAVLLDTALGQPYGSLHWLQRADSSVREAQSTVGTWTRQLSSQLAADDPDAVLLHYSVFAYSWRGIPAFVWPTLRAVRSSERPLVAFLHEFAHPWSAGWRGKVWATSHRAILVELMRASRAVVVTTQPRAAWLGSRPWLPRRRVVVAPVFSNLPPPHHGAITKREHKVVGMFGYGYDGAAVSLMVEAVRRLAERGMNVRLVFFGVAGRSAAVGRAALEIARRQRIEHLLSISGFLPAQALSDALASCDVLFFPDSSGPTSRKGTLAAALASGTPVVALDGTSNWPVLLNAGAVALARPTPRALADTVGALLADASQRAALGARGLAFAERQMSLTRSVQAVTSLLEDVVRS
jgi:glycosyltransferase involved in cell wall biosynthesis